MKKLTAEEFIGKANKVHDNKYNYSKVEYLNNKIKVCIICPEHGEFWQRPDNHLNRHGCPVCKNLDTVQKFIKKAKKIHNNKYNYSKVEYKNSRTKICIICSEHGEFWQSPNSHLNNHGCPKCLRYTKKNFIKKAREIHGDKYDYSKVKYKKNNIKVCIICPIHGEFWQAPGNHLALKYGCPICSESKGEKQIAFFLSKNNINFERQKSFEECKNKKSLLFDFYLPERNLLIEYDGEQHYRPVTFFGGEKNFEYIKNNDKIKDNYCRKNNINLLRISYKDNINNKLFEGV